MFSLISWIQILCTFVLAKRGTPKKSLAVSVFAALDYVLEVPL